MPINYQFINSFTMEPVALASIDEEMCKELNIPCSPKRYSSIFQAITLVGDCVYKDGTFDEKAFREVMKDSPEDLYHMYKKYLHGKYIYKCWRR